MLLSIRPIPGAAVLALTLLASPAAQAAPAAPCEAPAKRLSDPTSEAVATAPSPSSAAPVLVDGAAPERHAGWQLAPTGYLRVGLGHVERDPSFSFVGRNNGFWLANARVGIDGHADVPALRFRISVDGAVDTDGPINTPQGTIDVRLADGWLAWNPHRWVRLRAGQFRVPFSAGELADTAGMLFMERALGQHGVTAGDGLELAGLEVGRQLGVEAAFDARFADEDVRVGARLALANGNGLNEVRNDNTKYAAFGRVEVGLFEVVDVGGALYTNVRTEGAQPNQFDERDVGVAVDAAVRWEGIEAAGQVVDVTTRFRTDGSATRQARAWHAQLGYTLPVDAIHVTPAVRYATYAPFFEYDASPPGVDLDTIGLQYLTAGVRVQHPNPNLGAALYLEYTVTTEDDTRSVQNNAFKALAQVTF